MSRVMHCTMNPGDVKQRIRRYLLLSSALVRRSLTSTFLQLYAPNLVISYRLTKLESGRSLIRQKYCALSLSIANDVFTMNQCTGTLIYFHYLYCATNISAFLWNLKWVLCEPERYYSTGLKSHEFHFKFLTLINIKSCSTASPIAVILVLYSLPCGSIFWQPLATK